MSSKHLEALQRSHAPCPHFAGACASMRWSPDEGHVPRGFCGATGSPEEVELILVTAEPGDPIAGERYLAGDLAAPMQWSEQSLRHPPTPFHQNIRRILNLCFPGLSLDQQMRHVWRTNSVLCSARVESGSVPSTVEITCAKTYLLPQIAAFPRAVVAALGGKAQRRLERAGIECWPALHPSSRKSNADKQASWQALADCVRARREGRG